MTVIEIIKKHLKDNGFDGLLNADAECGCDLYDLVPCDTDCSGCKPGYKINDNSGEHDYIITTKKPKNNQ